MKKILLTLVLICFVSFIGTASDVLAKPSPIYAFTEKDNETAVKIPRNTVFKLVLNSNPTTGYDWFVVGLNHKAFKIADSGFKPPKTELVGAGGIRWWRIKAIQKGEHDLNLLYYRPWEGKDKAAQVYHLKIMVL